MQSPRRRGMLEGYCRMGVSVVTALGLKVVRFPRPALRNPRQKTSNRVLREQARHSQCPSASTEVSWVVTFGKLR